MIKYVINPEQDIIAIADAIRNKNGSNKIYKVSEMPSAIEAIETSGGSIENIILEFNISTLSSEDYDVSIGWTSAFPRIYNIINENIDIVKKTIEYFSAGYNVYIKIIYDSFYELINICDIFNYPSGCEFKSSYEGNYFTITGQGVVGVLVNNQSEGIYDPFFEPYIFVEGTYVWHGGS